MRKLLFLTLTSILLFIGCATKGQVRPVDEQPVITGITIEDNAFSISASSSFAYTIYRSGEDPFKVIAEIQDVLPGVIIPGERIVSDRRGVREILPILTEGRGLKFEILLEAPLKEMTEFRDNVLVVRFIEEAPLVAEAFPQKGPEKIEILPAEPLKEEAPLAENMKQEIMEKPAELKPEVTAPVPAKEIKDIRVTKKNGIVEVEIIGDGALTPNVFPLDRRIVVDISGTVSKIKAAEAIAPVKAIRIGQHPDKTRIVLDMAEKASHEVKAEGDRVFISVIAKAQELAKVKNEKEAKVEKKEEMEIEKKEEAQPPIEKRIEPEKKEIIIEAQPQPLKYKGKRISLDFQEADITAILRLIGDVSGYNVVIHPDVRGKITLKLINVPWDQALDLILKTHGLDAVVEGNIIRIAPHAVLAKEYEEKAKAVEAGLKAEPLVTRVYSVNFADPKDVEKFIKDAKALSPRGNISIDARTSSLIIRDVEAVFPEIERLLRTVDKPTPQVLIDARIVEVNSSFVRDLGIQWGINWLSPNMLLRIGGPTGMPGGAGFTGTNFMVNLPAAVSAGSGGAIGLGYMNAQRTLSLDLQLSAMEGTGKGKVVSNPRIVTLDNQEAIIRQGKQIPVQTVSAEGTHTTILNAVLELKVKPRITPDGSIQMKLDTKKDEPDFTRLVGGVPTIDTNQATTEVLIQDGETLVIGGIFKKTEHLSEGGVPLLSKIPVFGWLFKKRRESEDTTELLIFITPRVVR